MISFNTSTAALSTEYQVIGIKLTWFYIKTDITVLCPSKLITKGSFFRTTDVNGGKEKNLYLNLIRTINNILYSKVVGKLHSEKIRLVDIDYLKYFFL